MDVQLILSGNQALINLGGDLTIDHAQELKSVLLQALRDANHITIDCDQVKSVDLSCLQLFCSAHREAVTSQKDLMLKSRCSETFRKVEGGAGFNRHKQCSINPKNTCLWMGENKNEKNNHDRG